MYPFILIAFAVAVDLAARAVAEGLDGGHPGANFRTKPLATGLLAPCSPWPALRTLAPGADAVREPTTRPQWIPSVRSSPGGPMPPSIRTTRDRRCTCGPSSPQDRVVVSGPTYWASSTITILDGRVDMR
jgi:hypothetical protein